MFSGSEKTFPPTHRSQAAADNLSKTRRSSHIRQAKSPLQLKPIGEEEEPVQKKPAIQLVSMEGPVLQAATPEGPVLQTAAPENKTGMPDHLKTGVESLSGFDLSDVRVHYNSSQPAQLNALAYAQGSDIHIGPGQEQHLPHEAWHIVQQRQGRVEPTTQLKEGIPVNDDPALEKEADLMGQQSLQKKS